MKTRGLVVSIVMVFALVGASVYGFLTGLKPQLGLDLVGGVSVVLTAPDGTTAPVMEKTLETIRARVDALGVAEPDISLQGDLNIQVQIPRFGGAGRERLLELIGKTARLEFREVLEEIAPGSPGYDELEISTAETSEELEDQEVIFPEADTPESQDPLLYRLGPVKVTGEAISEATATFNDPASVTDAGSQGWIVSFQTTSSGADLFEQATTELTGKQMAIVLDAMVESAPTVQDAISTQGQITLGNGLAPEAEREAKDLEVVLRTGALPVELEQSQVETVSATLGKESLNQGLLAGLVGLIALAIYLAFYYRLLGVVTWFGMAIWAVLALGLISLLGRAVGYSLTLAGVAGVVISLGVTADSYIVFYERLKDEVRKGKTVRASVAPAFARAWKTIIAADIVTIIAAVILYLMAIGSVRGFALTLGISTLLDMFVVYFYKRPSVFLIARSKFLSELPGMGLRSSVGVAELEPRPVRGGSK
ncbi:MAG: protein translocase subunit SecD [Actinomycetota bacterium]